jgi:hypothetical protein
MQSLSSHHALSRPRRTVPVTQDDERLIASILVSHFPESASIDGSIMKIVCADGV